MERQPQSPKKGNARNYQKELEQLIARLDGRAPHLLLHSCCAPCSSYVMEYLRHYFRITVFYHNPNISEQEEYHKRAAEQQRLIEAFNGLTGCGYPIKIIEGEYEPSAFYAIARGLEQCPEGGERCAACYELRLDATARRAAAAGAAFFGTTLTISPLKDAAKLNEIGERLADKYQVAWLPGDFKKKNGFKRSIELSGEYGLYRQDYCGCVYSRR